MKRGTPKPFDPTSRGATGGSKVSGSKTKPAPRKTGTTTMKSGSKRSK